MNKLTVAGFKTCKYFQKAANVCSSLEVLYSEKYTADIMEFQDKELYLKWLSTAKNILVSEDGAALNHKSSPICFLNDKVYIGGCDNFLEYSRKILNSGSASHHHSKISPVPIGYQDDTVKDPNHGFTYDLFVIGGGSGGLATAKAAAGFGAKVALADFVKPSWQGSSWGLGGTCVNVGCIPKKCFHHAALLGEGFADARAYGWKGVGTIDDAGNLQNAPTIPWQDLIHGIQDHIASLNFGYKVQMREKNVKYINSLASFVDPHTIELTDKKGRKETVTARRIVIAVGGRPKKLGCPGEELAISSDDIFSMEKPPGKTLVVGASYVALECAGFLTSLGYDVTVMVRSILLRGFDQDMAERIGKYMQDHGTKFIRDSFPTKLEEVPGTEETKKIRVTWGNSNTEEFDTVLCAVGRVPETTSLGLDKAGVKILQNGKLHTVAEQTNVPHIYAIGDVLEGKLELTPTAIHAGKLLAERLFNNSKEQMDYENICTTIFTPLEYGTVGLSEEVAINRFGESNVEVYHSNFIPLEWAVPHDHRNPNDCYCKAIVHLADNNRVVGLHFLGPNAGEVIQGYGVGMKMGMTYEDLSSTIGIHPTVSEEIVGLTKTKRSGENPEKTGC